MVINSIENSKLFELTICLSNLWVFIPNSVWQTQLYFNLFYVLAPVVPDGVKGGNKIGLKNSKDGPPLKNPCEAIINYKTFVRKHMPNNPMRRYLQNLLSNFDESHEITKLFRVVDLIKEYLSLELQFPKLGHKIDFLPLFANMLRRIKHKNVLNKEDIKGIYYLYTAVSSKVSFISGKISSGTVLQLKDYLEKCQEEIENLKKMSREKAILDRQSMYKASIQEKMKYANKVIKTDILPHIDNIFRDIDKKTKDLLEEISEHKTISTEQLANKDKLKEVVKLETVLSCIKVVGDTLSLFAQPGVGAGIVNGATDAEKLTVDKSKMEEYSQMHLLDVQNLTDDAKIEIAKLCKGFDNQFKDISDVVNAIPDEKHCSRNPNSESSKVLQSLREMVKKHGKYVNPGILKEAIINLKHFLHAESTDLQNKIDSADEAHKKVYEHEMAEIDKVKVGFEAAQMPIFIYTHIVGGNGKYDRVKEDIKSLEMQLDLLKQHELNIYSAMYPMFRSVESGVSKMAADILKGKSQLILDLARWQTQNNLENVKRLINNMVRAIGLEEEYMECYDKLVKGIDLMIDTNDRIDTHHDQCNLATYFADLSSVLDNINMQDTELRDAMVICENMLMSNIVLERYKTALDAYKQHHYPFATFFLKDLSLNLNYNTKWDNDADHNLITQASANIGKMISSRKTWTTLHNEFHNYICYVNSTQLMDKPSSDPPFYTWKYDDNKNDLIKLLSGEEVEMFARGYGNVVKFKEIGLNFNFQDRIQKDFNEAISNFIITLTMGSENRYFCGGRYIEEVFQLTSNIQFRFKINSDGSQTIINETYKIIKNQTNDYFLSPYTAWRIQLSAPDILGHPVREKDHFQQLERYRRSRFDMDLVGAGQYLKRCTVTDEACEYYDSDDPFTNLNV